MSKSKSTTANSSNKSQPTSETQPERPGIFEDLRQGGQDIWNKIEKYVTSNPTSMAIIGVALLVVGYAYWNTLVLIERYGWSQPQYSHGYLIPIIAVAMLMMRAKPIGRVSTMERWIGVGIIGIGIFVRLFAAKFTMNTVDMGSLIFCLIGVFMLAGGFGMIRWAWAPLLFLVFMMPVPMFIENTVLLKLQTVATKTSTYALQTMGVEAFRDGNRIELDQTSLGVIDQCSGLRMVTIFVAMSVAIVMMVSLTWWEKIVVLASSIPIAILVNTIRITSTALMYVGASDYDFITDSFIKGPFHDGAGYAMVFLALGFLFFELWIFSKLFIKVNEAKPKMAVPGKSRATPRTPSSAGKLAR